MKAEVDRDGFVAADVERRRGVVEMVLRISTIAAALVAGVSLAVGPAIDFVSALAAAGYLGVLWFGSRRWRLEVVTVGATLGLVVVATYAMVVGNGVHDVVIVALPIAVLSAGLLLDLRRALAVGAVALAGTVCVGVCELNGWLAVQETGRVRLNEICVLLILLVAGGAVSATAVHILNQALAQARAAERNYREVFNATSEAMLVFDPAQNRVVDVNDPAVAMLGLSREQILSDPRSLVDAGTSPYGLAEARRWSELAFAHGQQVFEWLFQAPDGRQLWLEIAMRRARIGGRECVMIVARDIDARKRMEEREQQADRLRAVGALAGGVAHDFNNQLTGILGYVELLQTSEATSPELRESLLGIRTAARRAADLTRQLLAFARKGKLREVPVDLHATVHEVTALLSRSIDKRIRVEQRLEASVARTMGDPSQLSSALLNLAINARDAMPSGGTLIFATDIVDLQGDACRRPPFDLSPGRHVRLRVTDTGAGIDPSVRGRIFEPFFTTKESGTGMGLAAVYGTVTAHHGAIEVDSTPGEGSTFTLLMPVADGAANAEITGGPTVIDARPRGRVLVVDDELLVVRVVHRMLTRAGYEVVPYTSARQALADVRLSPLGWDAAVIDVIMPEMNGEQLLQQLLALVPDLAAVLVSGFVPDAEQRRPAPELAEVVRKPFTTAELLAALAAALQARQRAA